MDVLDTRVDVILTLLFVVACVHLIISAGFMLEPKMIEGKPLSKKDKRNTIIAFIEMIVIATLWVTWPLIKEAIL